MHEWRKKAADLLHRHGAGAGLFMLGCLLPWLAFIDLAEDVWRHDGFAPDRAWLAWLQAHRRPPLDAVAVQLSRLGGTLGMWSFGLGLVAGLGLAGRRRPATLVGAALFGAWLMQLGAKALLERPRPAEWEPLVEEPLLTATVYSFPSGHAMAAAALANSLILLLWPTRWRWPATVVGTLWASSMGVARVYLGAHYPSDVLAGWVGSVGWVTGLYLLFFREAQRPDARVPGAG